MDQVFVKELFNALYPIDYEGLEHNDELQEIVDQKRLLERELMDLVGGVGSESWQKYELICNQWYAISDFMKQYFYIKGMEDYKKIV